MPQTRFIPTLSELRTFEAIARLRSISSAAAELNCSQPTATWRLRELEKRWAVTLFNRSTRQLEWTDTTQRLYSRVRLLITEIESISAEFEGDSNQLNVSVSQSFAATWLVDRLPTFSDQFPQIDLRLSATNRYIDLNREAFDVGVRLLPRDSEHPPASDNTLLLGDERLIIVCSPAYASRWQGNMPISALMEAKLLWHAEGDHWRRFFAVHCPGEQPSSGPKFNNVDLVIRSAIAHQGVAIVRELLASDSLRLGHLLRPCLHSIECDDAYYQVSKQGIRDSFKVTAWREWLQREIAVSVAQVRNHS